MLSHVLLLGCGLGAHAALLGGDARAGTMAKTRAPIQVQVQQFGMCQCPMTSSWFSGFYDACLKDRPAMLELINFTQYYVGGKHGGHVTASSWNSSFHGYEEVIGDRYQLCARALASTTDKQWLEFESCQNGLGGVVGIASIPGNSAHCASLAGIDGAALKACAEGSQGLALFKDSVYYTSNHNITYDTLKPGSGKLENIPVVHIEGVEYTGFDAYSNLTARLCAHAPDGATCGCADHVMTARYNRP